MINLIFNFYYTPTKEVLGLYRRELVGWSVDRLVDVLFLDHNS